MNLPIIQDERKVSVPIDEGEEIVIEANWDELVTPCKALKIHMGGKTSLVVTDKLIATLMFFVNNSQMNKLLQKSRLEVKEYEAMLEVVVNKDIKSGEKIMLPVSVKLPLDGAPVISALTSKY